MWQTEKKADSPARWPTVWFASALIVVALLTACSRAAPDSPGAVKEPEPVTARVQQPTATAVTAPQAAIPLATSQAESPTRVPEPAPERVAASATPAPVVTDRPPQSPVPGAGSDKSAASDQATLAAGGETAREQPADATATPKSPGTSTVRLPTAASTPVPALEPTATARPEPTATPVPSPTAGPEPTATSRPGPSSSPSPTSAPQPSATPNPKPTATAIPTATPEPPTPIPEPTAEPVYGTEVGDAAPPFMLPSISGDVYELADSRGRPTVLVFYRAFW